MATGATRRGQAAKEPPIQSLNMFLIKPGTRVYEDALEEKEVASLTKHGLTQSLPFRGALFLAPQRKAPPRWLAFLESGAGGDLQKMYNASTSAILFIRASRRVFAFTFGYGRSLLRPTAIERAFGLRVVLNAVDEAGLRSVDTKTVQELTVHTRRQTSRASRLAEFDVDKEEDLLGAVAGVPRDPGLARVLSGADALQLRAPIEFKELGEKCRSLLRTYRSEAYKDRGFEFVDNVQRVSDPTVIDALDADLTEDLQARAFDGIHMAPPEIIDWEQIDGFSFVKSADPEADLALDSLFDQIRKADVLSVKRLKAQKVFLHLAGTTEPVAKWPVYRTLVAERELRGHRYALSAGEWYEIEQNFVERIRKRVARIKSSGLGLPKARPGEKEKDYNSRVSRSGLYCLDQKCPRADGNPIELCDLYVSNKRQFVHVKRWKASSTLSHLFAQGRVAAETLLSDETFRKEARKLLGSKASSLTTHIPTDRPDPTKYQVVYAIIKGGKKGWRKSLPFFSQLHLVRSAEALRRLGFEVRLEQIEVEG